MPDHSVATKGGDTIAVKDLSFGQFCAPLRGEITVTSASDGSTLTLYARKGGVVSAYRDGTEAMDVDHSATAHETSRAALSAAKEYLTASMTATEATIIPNTERTNEYLERLQRAETYSWINSIHEGFGSVHATFKDAGLVENYDGNHPRLIEGAEAYVVPDFQAILADGTRIEGDSISVNSFGAVLDGELTITSPRGSELVLEAEGSVVSAYLNGKPAMDVDNSDIAHSTSRAILKTFKAFLEQGGTATLVNRETVDVLKGLEDF